MGRRGASSIAANPVLIGAATTLVVIVAVFLAYNANNGLPFVPTYELKAEVPNAANLVKGNEVRVGGTRVGVVNAINPKKLDDGRVVAELDLKLETTVEPLPKDSTLIVRPRSALGLKYVEVTPGDPKGPGFQNGDTIPLRNATPEPVEIDEVFNTFDEATRAAMRRNTDEFSNAFVGRGQDLNRAITALDPLLENLVPVMENLADPETRLGRLFQELGDAAAIVAPAAETQAELFRNLDATFAALSDVREQIQETIDEGPATLDTAVRSFRVQRPFLRNSEGLFRELRPGVRALRTAAPALAEALEVGTPALRRSNLLNERLGPVFTALQEFAEDPLVPRGVRQLTKLAETLNPTLAFLRPVQTRCNYVSLWFRNVSSLLSEGDSNGTWQRFIIIAAPQGPNNEGAQAAEPANGPNQDNFLHVNPYPNVGAPGQTVECEAGNEEYLVGRQVIGNVPGRQSATTEKTTIDKSTEVDR